LTAATRVLLESDGTSTSEIVIAGDHGRIDGGVDDSKYMNTEPQTNTQKEMKLLRLMRIID